MIYFIIFLLKATELTLATLRLIVVSNGKKILGAILQIIISILWIFVTSSVLVDIHHDFLKIVAFVIGSGVGSYFGSFLEEKLALGSILMVVHSHHMEEIRKVVFFPKMVYNSHILTIALPRKRKRKMMHRIKEIDKEALIFIQNVKTKK